MTTPAAPRARDPSWRAGSATKRRCAGSPTRTQPLSMSAARTTGRARGRLRAPSAQPAHARRAPRIARHVVGPPRSCRPWLRDVIPSFAGGWCRHTRSTGSSPPPNPLRGPTSGGRWCRAKRSILMDGAIAAWMDDGMYARLRPRRSGRPRHRVSTRPRRPAHAAAWQAVLVAMTAIMLGGDA